MAKKAHTRLDSPAQKLRLARIKAKLAAKSLDPDWRAARKVKQAAKFAKMGIDILSPWWET